MKFKVYTDGWSRWNPWNAWIWVYITDWKWKEIEKRYKHLGEKTNNQAEYTGALFGIKRAVELGAKEIELYMDSKLVIEQLSGNFKIKNADLKKIYNDIQDVLWAWSVKVSFIWIPREKNKEADRLSNIAMDEGEE